MSLSSDDQLQGARGPAICLGWNAGVEAKSFGLRQPLVLKSSTASYLGFPDRAMGSILGSKRSPGGGNGDPFQHSCLERISWIEETGGLIVHGPIRAGHDLETTPPPPLIKFCYLEEIISLF